MTTTTAAPPETETMARRFSGAKLEKVLEKLGKNSAWLAGEVGVREQSVTNWLSGKKPEIDSYLDLVDALARVGVPESAILVQIK